MVKVQTPSCNVFFTSDLHLMHENIILYCNRPFRDADEMDEILIDNYNQVVPDSGEVFILGDLLANKKHKDRLVNYTRRLNGKKHLILGNHDYFDDEFYTDYCGFESVNHYLEISVGDQIIILFHYPLLTWNRISHGSWMLYGHVHGSFNRVKNAIDQYICPLNEFVGKKTMDIGVDVDSVNHFFPYSFNEIKNYMDRL